MRITYGPGARRWPSSPTPPARAEDAGAEVVWVPELHRSATVRPRRLAAADHHASASAPAIALAFTRSPMITALEALDLDELSGGRFVLGLGTGVQRLNEDWHHVDWGKPVTHLRETVRNIRAVLGRLHHRRADRPRRRARADADPRLPAPLPGAAHRHPRSTWPRWARR